MLREIPTSVTVVAVRETRPYVPNSSVWTEVPSAGARARAAAKVLLCFIRIVRSAAQLDVEHLAMIVRREVGAEQTDGCQRSDPSTKSRMIGNRRTARAGEDE